jgi:hypothetical protein
MSASRPDLALRSLEVMNSSIIGRSFSLPVMPSMTRYKRRRLAGISGFLIQATACSCLSLSLTALS